MAIADKLLELNQAKQDIKNAIETKGVSTSGVPFTNYASKILEISVGGGMTYEDYARTLYLGMGKSNQFTDAWQDMEEVDGTEIERSSNFDIQYGTLQYPNGEDNGVIIPDGVTSVGYAAFYSWTANNQPLVIPDSVTEIGFRAFADWRANTHPLIIPNSVTSISNDAFGSWTANNQPLVIPDSVTSIGNFIFQSWRANTHPLIIPNSVTSIGLSAFSDWQNVPYVEMKSSTPPTLGNANAFSNQNEAPIYVPDESVDDYKTATNWVDLASRIFAISEKP